MSYRYGSGATTVCCAKGWWRWRVRSHGIGYRRLQVLLKATNRASGSIINECGGHIANWVERSPDAPQAAPTRAAAEAATDRAESGMGGRLRQRCRRERT